MEIIPVIDMKGGQVVHAQAGRRDDYRPIQTPLSPSSAPQDVVAGLLRLFRFRCLYIADLDAIEWRGNHDTALARLAREHPDLDLWVDNGIGDEATAVAWLDRDLGRLVIGSESQNETDLLRTLRGHPRVALSLDFRGDAFVGPMEILQNSEIWPERVIVMTLARVGAGQGPDLQRLADIRGRASGQLVYAAGGVRNIADLRALAEMGVAGALVATALHAGAITTADLESLARPGEPGKPRN
jgi:phosphoribosylformimino-5-aminoimidazole carboxamide ribotide isomerase